MRWEFFKRVSRGASQRAGSAIAAAILMCGIATAQIDPHTQIRWPSNCSAAGMVYSFELNSCIVNGTGSSGTGFNGGLGTSYQDAAEIAAPANPAAGDDRLWLDSTTHQLSCHTSSGASCMPAGGSGTVFCTPNAQTGITYTLVLTDGTASGSACIGTVTMTNASINTVTVPPNSSVAFPTPDEIDLVQLGAGQTCFAAGVGVTLTTPTSLCARAQNSTIGIRQISANTWIVFGDTQ